MGRASKNKYVGAVSSGECLYCRRQQDQSVSSVYSLSEFPTLTSLCKNFRRASGTRSDFQLFPALEAPGYCQTPLWGEDTQYSFQFVFETSFHTDS